MQTTIDRTLNQRLLDLFDTVIGDNYNDKLYNLSLCECCDRHKTNKPFLFITWVETPPKENQVTSLSCTCMCRHISRHICRQCPDIPPPPPSSPRHSHLHKFDISGMRCPPRLRPPPSISSPLTSNKTE